MPYIRHVLILLVLVFNVSFLNAAEMPEDPIPKQKYNPPKTVAVITFQTLPGNIKENYWLGTGLSEALSDRLEAAEFESLSVYTRRESTKISRKVGTVQGSINPYNSSQIMSLKQEMKPRGVDYLVIGSIQSPGKWDNPKSEFTLNANIVSVKSGNDSGELMDAISLSGSFGAGGAGLFAAQTELLVKMVEALGINPSDFKRASLSQGQTSDILAFKSYSEAIIAFDNEDYETAKNSFFKAYQITGGAYHSALLMFEKSDELRIEALEAAGSGFDVTAEIEAGDTLLEELEAKQEAHLATIKFVRAQRCVWKQQRYLEQDNREKANDQGKRALEFLAQFDDLNRNKALLWSSDILSTASVNRPFIHNGIIVTSSDGWIYAFEEKTGREIWKFDTGADTISFFMYFSAGCVVSQTSSGVFVLDIDTGKLHWKYPPGQTAPLDTNHSLSVKTHGDIVVILTEDSSEKITRLWAHDTQTGAEKWTAEYQSDFAMMSPLENHLLVSLEDHDRLLCLNLNDGSEQWTLESKISLLTSPMILDDKIIAVENGMFDPTFKVHALNPRDGGTVWTFEAPGMVESDIVHLDGLLFFVVQDMNIQEWSLYAVENSTGEQHWKYTADFVLGKPGIAGKQVYITSEFNGNDPVAIVGFDEGNGELRWTFHSPESQLYSHAATNDKIFLGTYQNNVITLDAKTGEKAWDFETRYMPRMLAGADPEAIYVFDHKGVYALGLIQGGAGPSDTNADLLRADAQILMKDLDAAKKTLQALLERKPNIPDAWRTLMDVCNESGDSACVAEAGLNFYSRYSDDDSVSQVQEQILAHTPVAWRARGKLFAVDSGRGFVSHKNLISAFDLETGAEIWSFKAKARIVDWGGQPAETIMLDGGRLFFMCQTDEDEMDAGYTLDVSTGKQLWSFEEAEIDPAFYLYQDSVFYLTDPRDHDDIKPMSFDAVEKKLVSIDRETGEERWNFAAEGWIYGKPVFHDDFVAIITSGSVVVLNRITGDVMLQANSRGHTNVYFSGNKIIWTNRSSSSENFSEVTAYNLNSGDQIWLYKTDGEILDNAAAADGAFCFVTSNSKLKNGMIACLDENHGAEIWKHELLSDPMGARPPVVQNGKVYVETRDYVYDTCLMTVLDRQSGNVVWEFDKCTRMRESDDDTEGRTILVRDNRMYFFKSDYSTDQWTASALEQDNGKLIWEYSSDGMVSTYPVLSDGLLFVTSALQKDETLRAINSDTGGIEWSDTMKCGYLYSAPPLVANNNIYISCYGYLAEFDAKTGNNEWKLELGTVRVQTPIAADNMLLVNIRHADKSRSVVAISLDKAKRMVENGERWWSDPGEQE